MFTFSLKLEKWSFHVPDLPRRGKKGTEIIKALEGRAKVLFCFIKYAKFVVLSLPSRRIGESLLTSLFTFLLISIRLT